MLTIQQSSLRFKNGKSEKVYEVDLIDLEKNEDKQYLVNFRYGRLGGRLLESTKTVSPVTLEKAQNIYSDLVALNVNKGYVLSSGFDPITGENIIENAEPKEHTSFEEIIDSTSPIVQKNTETLDQSVSDQALENQTIEETSLINTSFRTGTNEALIKRQTLVHKKFKEYLKNPSNTISLSKCIWRLGELHATQAIDDLISNSHHFDPNNEVLNYTIAWTLGRLGDAKATELLNKFTQNTAENVQRMAIQALFHVASSSEHPSLYTQYQAQLTDSLKTIISSSNDPQSLSKKVIVWAEEHKSSNRNYSKGMRDPQIDITYLYLLAKQDKKLRQCIIDISKYSRFSYGQFWLIRVLFKLAEFELDAELLGILVKRIEDNSPQTYDAYNNETRTYFRRRSWRLLQRIGDIEDDNYVRLATELLTQYDDHSAKHKDKASSAKKIVYDWNKSPIEKKEINYHYPIFSSHQAFNQILYRHSTKIKNSNYWCMTDTRPEENRTEAFPKLWDKHPNQLLHCLTLSQSKSVNDFALKALKDNNHYCQSISLESFTTLLNKVYVNTVLFAQELVKKHHPVALEEITFLRKLIPARTIETRSFMQMYLKRITDNDLREDIDWHIDLIASEYEDNQQYAKQFFSLYDLYPEKKQLVLAKVMSFILTLQPQTIDDTYEFPLKETHWDYIKTIVLEILSTPTKALSFDIINDLINHPCVEIQRLGGKIIVLQEHKPEDIPDDIFLALIQSDDNEIQSMGVRLLSNLSDNELETMPDLLVSFLSSNAEQVRHESRLIIKRVASNNTKFCSEVLHSLIPHIFKAESIEGQHDTYVECISEDLQKAWPSINKDLLWRLLMAQSKAAQRVGSALLMMRPHQEYSVRQWSHLSKHATNNVRRWACDAYTRHTVLIREQFPSALRILDNDWDDSRLFAITYFRESFDDEKDANKSDTVWSPENLMLLCDSVRDDVQRLGRDLLRQLFKEEQGEEYLLKLSQHPSQNIQLFASEFLQNYAGGKVETIKKLHDYFITVLSGVNKGRISKQRVLAFLLKEADQSKEVAKQLSLILERQSVTVAIQDKANFISAMYGLHKKYPDLTLPIQQKSIPIRGFTHKNSMNNNSEVA